MGAQSGIPSPRQSLLQNDRGAVPDASWWRFWRDPILGSLGFAGTGSSSGTGGITITVTGGANPNLRATVPGGGALQASVGASTAYGGVPVVPSVNVTATSNAGSTATDLMSFALPASSLAANGKGLRVTGWGVTANNASTKTLGVVFGGTTLLSTTLPISTAGPWKTVTEVFRAGSSSQVAMVSVYTVSSSGVAQIGMASTTAPENDQAAITVKHSATGLATTDITQRGQLVEFFN